MNIRERQNAARSVALKVKYPSIDDPIKAIRFAIGQYSEAATFLEVWECGDWFTLERDWPEFLEGLV